MINRYTRVLTEALALDGPSQEKVFDAVLAHLKSTGRKELLRDIHTELRKTHFRQVARAPKVFVASTKEAAGALAAANREGIHAEKALIDPSLIRGWRASEAGTILDRSAKRALISIYQKLTV